MKIPRKITPDRIRDSIVEFRYETKTPFEAFVGLFYQVAKDSFTYTKRPLGKPISVPSSLTQEINLSLGGISLFYNDKIKIQLQPNSIIFNCLDGYIGWENYKYEIEKSMLLFGDAIQIDSYTRIGMRYISEYPDMDLTDCAKFKFEFGMSEIKSEIYSFRSEFKWKDYKVLLNLNNRLLVVKEHGKEGTPTSIVDIDVIENDIEENSLPAILEKLESLHMSEKEIFFNILNDDFLKKLNPEY